MHRIVDIVKRYPGQRIHVDLIAAVMQLVLISLQFLEFQYFVTLNRSSLLYIRFLFRLLFLSNNIVDGNTY